MEQDIRKHVLNIQDSEIARFLSVIDPLYHAVKEEFDLNIIDEHWISLLDVPIYVKGIINVNATPFDVSQGFNMLFFQTKNETNIDRSKLLRCILKSESVFGRWVTNHQRIRIIVFQVVPKTNM